MKIEECFAVVYWTDLDADGTMSDPDFLSYASALEELANLMAAGLAKYGKVEKFYRVAAETHEG